MKGNSLLSFHDAAGDLTKFADRWIMETIESRESVIVKEIRSKRIKEMMLESEEEIADLEKKSPYALLPSKNIRLIREITFPVTSEVTVEDLKDIVPKIRAKFTIDCFQVAIDHESNTAHMVFDWYDRRHGECVYLYPNKRIRLSVFLVRELDLPRPEGYEFWLRHFLLEDFKEDDQIYKSDSEELKHIRLSRKTYTVLRNSVQYAELVCKKLVK